MKGVAKDHGVVSVTAPKRLRGEVRLPGDKSITHRALLLNALAEGRARITGAGMGDDCRSTLACLRNLGVEIEQLSETELVVHGKGARALREPRAVLDCGNSGTTMRLLLGVLAGLDFYAVLSGDESLRGRPMGRVTKPLAQMGATIWGRQAGDNAPLAVQGRPLRGIDYQLPVASAQVKSALLLAGMLADGPTCLRQPAISRDHTEIMLRAQGARIHQAGLELRVEGGANPRAVDVSVPGDISAAAFWMVAACIHPDAELVLRNVGVNPTRAGVLSVLRRMGAEFETEPTTHGGEPRADIRIHSSRLRGTEIGGAEIPLLLDELPVLALAASRAEGTTVITDAAELRVKESDRIASVRAELARMGARIEELPDGLVIDGGASLRGAEVDSHGDHRLAMCLGVAAMAAAGETRIRGARAAGVSDPGFWAQLTELAADHG